MVIAREWLTFVVLLAFGLTIAPLVVMAIVDKALKLAMLSAFYEALFSHDYWVRAWLILLAPYIIYQLGRSLVWAVKTTKGRSAHNNLYEVRLRKDHIGVDVISNALPFGRLWHSEPNAVSNAKVKRKAGALTPPRPAMGAWNN